MKLKTISKSGNITLKNYEEQECRSIFIERNSYVLECVRNYGDDYGGSQCSENRETTYEEIIPERILVRDGHFCGVLIITEYNYRNGGVKNSIEEVPLLIKPGRRPRSARSGFSFSNDDHSRWDYTDYYLIERPKEK